MGFFIYEQIIEKIKLEREFLKIYEYELANILKISDRTYRRKEKGESPFTLHEFLLICEKTKRSPSYYFGESIYNGFNISLFSNGSGIISNSYNTSDNVDDLRIIIDALVEKINRINNKEN
jgi:transcriptional regulator with XRE-family HTH domain